MLQPPPQNPSWSASLEWSSCVVCALSLASLLSPCGGAALPLSVSHSLWPLRLAGLFSLHSLGSRDCRLRSLDYLRCLSLDGWSRRHRTDAKLLLLSALLILSIATLYHCQPTSLGLSLSPCPSAVSSVFPQVYKSRLHWAPDHHTPTTLANHRRFSSPFHSMLNVLIYLTWIFSILC